MGIAQTAKNDFTFKLLSLRRSEIEELLTFLLRKLGYRVEEARWEGDLFYFHIVKLEGDQIHHALACWTGGKRIMAPDFLQSFLKTPPLVPPIGTNFERGFFLSPYEFHAEFRTEAERNRITPINGDTLKDFLIEHRLTYYFPSFLEAIGRELVKFTPVIVPALILVFAIFAFLTLEPQHTSVIQTQTPAPPPVAQPEKPSGPEVSLLNPSMTANVEEPLEIYKRIDIPKMTPAAKTASPSKRNELPENVKIETPPPALPIPHKPPTRTTVTKHHLGNATPSRVQSPPQRPMNPKRPRTPSSGTSAYQIISKYNRTVDLEEKYYSIARDLEKKHYNAKAKSYYLKYLQIAPDGDYADAARAALKRL